ncbi:HAD family phosphatase [Opitutales bacterium]|nr:HAD family phosphatase [Opitutales bacterium]
MMCKGAIFDWDGVIVDSSDLHLKSWEVLANELKLALPNDHFEKGFGKRNETIIPQILGWSKDPAQINHLGKRKEEIYRELGNKDGIKLARGSKDFLKLTPSSIFRCSVGTSTERKNVELAISQHNLSKYFLGAACSEDVSRGKPDPEVFLEAAKILSITPKNCVVFEDSPHGIEAAKRAGMKTVALTTTHPSTTFMHLNPDLLVASLADLGVDQVEKLFS